MLVQERQRKILHALLQAGRLSRSELHAVTGIRKNTICDDTAELLDQGILRELDALRAQRGRPRTPLEIDPDRRHVVGLAIRPGHVEVNRSNLIGQPIDEPQRKNVRQPNALISTAAELLASRLDSSTLSVGLSTPGLIDQQQHRLLLSSVAPESGVVSLEPLFAVGGQTPVILENDMHAIAACWLLTHRQDPLRDTLLVYLDDGQLGGSLLIAGRPNRGCVHGANELGHTRLGVETDVCYCGQVGCLERVLSTPFLHRLGCANLTLDQAIASFDGGDAALRRIIDLLGMGIANAVNLTRVDHLVLLGAFNPYASFTEALINSIRSQVLGAMATKVEISLWGEQQSRNAFNAGWLALANLFYEGWDRMPAE